MEQWGSALCFFLLNFAKEKQNLILIQTNGTRSWCMDAVVAVVGGGGDLLCIPLPLVCFILFCFTLSSSLIIMVIIIIIIIIVMMMMKMMMMMMMMMIRRRMTMMMMMMMLIVMMMIIVIIIAIVFL